MYGKYARSILVLWFTAASSCLFAFDTRPALSIPENAAVRRLSEAKLFAPFAVAASYRPTIEIDPESGGRVRFETAEQGGALYLMFLNQTRGDFPIAGAGNWIIKRGADGAFLQAKVFLQHSERSFVRIYPGGRNSLMDVYLEGVIIHASVPVQLPFETLILAPFSRIVELTRYRIDWSILVPQAQRPPDRAVEALSAQIRAYLPELEDADDGALDADGTYRFIEDLTENLASGFNCSGFAKWVVDGMVHPFLSRYLSIESLKERHLQLRGNAWSEQYEQTRDPYFGLDWTRNLALAYRAALGEGDSDPEAADVRGVRFFDYVEDIGFEIAELPVILYLLAIDRPGSVYLGSVNQAFGSAPVLRQHVHVVLFFPYFDADGLFRVDVMERNLETSLDSLEARYPSDFVHLVSIPAGARFEPILP